MAYTGINKSSEHFDTKVYTGNGTSQTLDMDNLGMLWMKNRTETSNHNLFDSVRGGYYTSAPGPNLRPNSTTEGHGSDITSAYGITFGSSSSTIGSDGGGYNYNQNGKSYVGWQWRANGSGSANTDGSISSTVSVNTTAGFSIVSYTGNGTAGATIGHGLGAVPKVVIVKKLNASGFNWVTQHASIFNSSDTIVALDSSDAAYTQGVANFNGTAAGSSVFTVGSGGNANDSGATYISYCFAEKTGYSKFGSYTGNASTDGTFVYTGFKPAFFLFKRTDAVKDWHIIDAARDVDNPTQTILYPNLSDAEGTPTAVDFLSNGIKIRNGGSFVNEVNGTYIYMAFAEAPLVGTNNVPCTAR